jgi:uncharacterized protein YndB with AHSA1/START domain
MNDTISGTVASTTPIRWKIHLRSSPPVVFDLIATPEGRARFWADSAEEADGSIHFVFRDGARWSSPVLERDPPRRFRLSYFDGSVATFELAETGGGSTELTLTETGVPRHAFLDNHAGWISVLLNLKAVADFGADLRNGDPARGWGEGYVDV